MHYIFVYVLKTLGWQTLKKNDVSALFRGINETFSVVLTLFIRFGQHQYKFPQQFLKQSWVSCRSTQ